MTKVDNDRKTNATRYSINAVATAMTVFDRVVEDGVVSLDTAAEVAGVSRSTAYRLVMTLVEIGLMERAEGGGYEAGPTAFQWASKLLNQLDVRAVASPYLHRLRDSTGESVNLALLRDSELIYVEVLESPGLLRTVEEPGTKVPIHAAAMGKAVAAHLPPEQLGRILGPEPYEKYTGKSATTWTELIEVLDVVRDDGFALDDEEVSEGVACVAAPLMLNGRVIGAMSVSGPTTRMTPARIRGLGKQVCKVAGDISRVLARDSEG